MTDTSGKTSKAAGCSSRTRAWHSSFGSHSLGHRLGSCELLKGSHTVFERALGVVGHLAGDRLPALVPIADSLHVAVQFKMADLLKILEAIDHRLTPVTQSK